MRRMLAWWTGLSGDNKLMVMCGTLASVLLVIARATGWQEFRHHFSAWVM